MEQENQGQSEENKGVGAQTTLLQRLKKRRGIGKIYWGFALIQLLFQIIKYVLLGGAFVLGSLYLSNHEKIVDIVLFALSILATIGFTVWAFLSIPVGNQTNRISAFIDKEVRSLRLTKENLQGATFEEAEFCLQKGISRVRRHLALGSVVAVLLLSVLYLGVAFALMYLAKTTIFAELGVLYNTACVEIVLVLATFLAYAIYIPIHLAVEQDDYKKEHIQALIYKYSMANCWSKCNKQGCNGLALDRTVSTKKCEELSRRGYSGSYSTYGQRDSFALTSGGTTTHYAVYGSVQHTFEQPDEYKKYNRVTRKCVCQKCGNVFDYERNERKSDYTAPSLVYASRMHVLALGYLLEAETPSISVVQRKCSIGYGYAKEIVDYLEKCFYLTSENGGRGMQLLITKESFEKLAEENKQYRIKSLDKRYATALQALLDDSTPSINTLKQDCNMETWEAKYTLDYLESAGYLTSQNGGKYIEMQITKAELSAAREKKDD